MSWLIAVVSLAVGLIIGSRLPAALGWWRRHRYRRAFRPVLLRPYHPAGTADNGDDRPGVR